MARAKELFSIHFKLIILRIKYYTLGKTDYDAQDLLMDELYELAERLDAYKATYSSKK